TSLTFPDGAQYSSMTYDPEGDITGFNVSAPSNWSAPSGTDPATFVSAVEMAYDPRGEITYMGGADPALSGSYETVEQNTYIHGHPCNQVNPNLPTQIPPCAVDPKTGSGLLNLPLPTKTCSYGGTMQFDASGRIIENDIAEQGDTNLGCNVLAGAQTAETRKYDAENHTVDDNCKTVTLLVPNQCTQAG